MIWLAMLSSCCSLHPEQKFRKGDAPEAPSSGCAAAQPQGPAGSPGCSSLQCPGGVGCAWPVPQSQLGLPRSGGEDRELWALTKLLWRLLTLVHKSSDVQSCICVLGAVFINFAKSSWEASLGLVQWGLTGSGTMKAATGHKQISINQFSAVVCWFKLQH